MSDTEIRGLSEVIVRLNALPDAMRRSIAAAVYGQALRVQSILKEQVLAGDVVKLRTKRLRDSVHIEMTNTPDEVVARIGTDVEYAKYLELGTPAHEIVARNAKALAFMLGGVMVFFKKVHHPGTPALRPFGNTLDREAPAIRAAVIAAANQAVQQ